MGRRQVLAALGVAFLVAVIAVLVWRPSATRAITCGSGRPAAGCGSRRNLRITEGNVLARYS